MAKKELDGGSLGISIKLTTPINCSDEYDKVIEMFNWEVKEEIEYVHDETTSSKNAKFANSVK